MRALLRAELLKLRTTRTFVALVGAAVLVSLLVVVLSAALSEDVTADDVRGIFASDFSALFILLLGIIGMTGEWRHRTITSTVLAAPGRARLLAAKVISYAVAGVVLSLIVSVAIMLVGTLILAGRDETTLGIGDLGDVLWRNLLVAAFLGALGVCFGALVRNQVVAIVAVLVLGFVVEPVLLGVAGDVGRFGPTVGAPNGVVGISFGDETPLEPAVAVLVLVGWVAVLFAAAAALLERRDLF